MSYLDSAKRKLGQQFESSSDPRAAKIYIPPLGAERENASEGTFELLKEVVNRLLLRESLRSLLILGDAGMGKTCLSLHFCQKFWEMVNKGKSVPLPVYIYLPQYKDYLAGKHLLDEVLKEAHLSENERYAIMEQPLILLLDGFDEVDISHNIYVTQGWGQQKYNIKILTTCRPEALINQSYQRLFEANVAYTHEHAHFETLYLQPFNKTQITRYLERYLEEHRETAHESLPSIGKGKEEIEGNAINLAVTTTDHSDNISLNTYLAWLEQLPSLEELVSTPFLLTIAASSLPRIMAELSRSSSSQDVIVNKQFTQTQLFRYFLDDWFFKQARRAKNRGELRELTENEIARYMRAYAQNLAMTRFSRRGLLDEAPLKEEDCLKPELVEPTHDKELLASYRDPNPNKAHWRLFFSMDEKGYKTPIIHNLQVVRSGCLLHTIGGRFKFLHKSITEYLAASELMEGTLGNYAHSLETFLNQESHQAQRRQGLGRALLHKQPQVIRRLAEATEENPRFKKLLYDILIASKEVPELGIVAANAITILNQAGVDFSGQDLSDVQISGAILASGSFAGTNFASANLSGVNLRGAYLNYADFRGANLEHVQFGERAYWSCPSGVNCLDYYQPNKNTIHWLAGCEDGHIYRFDGKTGKLLANLRHYDYFEKDTKKAVKTLWVHSSTHLMVTSGANNKVWHWDLRDNKDLKVGDFSVSALRVSHSGKTLISGGVDGTVRLWYLSQNTSGPTLEGHTSLVSSLSLSDDDKTLVSGSSDGTIRVWYLPQGASGAIFGGFTQIRSLSLSHNGKTLISGDAEGTIQLWSLPRGAKGPTLRGHIYSVESLVLSHDSKTLISGEADGTLRFWYLPECKEGPILKGHSDSINALKLSTDGRTVISGGGDNTIRFWYFPQRTESLVLKGHKEWVTGLDLTPDGKTLISGGIDCTIRLWHLPQGTLGLKLQEDDEGVDVPPISTLTLSRDGNTLMSGSLSDKCIRFWHLPRGASGSVLTGHTGSITALILSQDGKILISGSFDHTIRFWHLPQGTPGPILKGHTDLINTLSLSHDGKILVSGGEDSTIRFWSLPDGNKELILRGHTGPVYSFAKAGSNLLISGSVDTTIRLWHLPHGSAGSILKGHTSWVRALITNPDNKTLISGSNDNTIRLWRLPEGICLSVIPIGFPISSPFVYQDHQLFVGGYNGHLLSFGLPQSIYSHSKPSFSWLSRSEAKFSLGNAQFQGALNLSEANYALCQQRGAIGKPSSVMNAPYQAWCTLFQPIPGTAHLPDHRSLIKVEGSEQRVLTENMWVVSTARKIVPKQNFIEGFFKTLSGTNEEDHGFLIIEGIKNHRRFVIRAELVIDTSTSHVQIKLFPLDDFGKFKASAQRYVAKQFSIPAEQGKALLDNIRQDQRREIKYNPLGGSSVNLSSASSSSSSSDDASAKDNTVEYHNCLTWCDKQIVQLGFDIKPHWYNFIVKLPSNLDAQDRSTNQNRLSSSSLTR